MKPIWTLWKWKSRLSLRRIEPRFLGSPIRSPLHRLQYQGKRSSYAAEITGDYQFGFWRHSTNTEQTFYVRQLQENERDSSGTIHDQPFIDTKTFCPLAAMLYSLRLISATAGVGYMYGNRFRRVWLAFFGQSQS